MPIGTRLINHRAEKFRKKNSVKVIANISFDLKKEWKCLVESGRDRGRATERIKCESEEHTTDSSTSGTSGVN
jgi:hypothetical protein